VAAGARRRAGPRGMIEAAILWRRLDTEGHDSCQLFRLADGWRLTGMAVFGHEGKPALPRTRPSATPRGVRVFESDGLARPAGARLPNLDRWRAMDAERRRAAAGRGLASTSISVSRRRPTCWRCAATPSRSASRRPRPPPIWPFPSRGWSGWSRPTVASTRRSITIPQAPMATTTC